MKKKAVSKLKWLIIIVIGLGLIFAALSGISYIRLYRTYAALEKDNRPMKLEEIIPPAVADTENAALLYKSVFLRLKAEAKDDESLLDYMQRLSDKVIKDPNEAIYAEMETLLASDAIKNALSCIEQGVQRTGCRFDVNYEDGFNIDLDFVTELKALAKLLAAKALVELRQGETQQAWHTIEVLFRFSDAMRREPTFIPQVARMAQVNLAVETVFQVTQKSPPDERQQELLCHFLTDFEDNAPIIAAFDGERILFGEWLFNNLSQKYFRKHLAETYSGDFLPEFLITLYFWCKPVLNSDHSTYLSILHNFTNSARQPYYSLDPNRDDEKIAMDLPKYLLISRSLIPAGFKIHQIYTRMTAKLRLARTGLDIIRYRQRHGDFPESLDDLEISPPPDPFTGKQLIYRRQSSGFILYSVGEDLQDNNGIAQQKKAQTWDIVWNYVDSRANP